MMYFLPIMYKDEILYSILARYAVRDCSSRVIHAMSDIYTDGKRHIPTFEIPNMLDTFMDNLPIDHDVSIEKIIQEHSMLPFYTAFKSHEGYREIIENIRNGSASIAYMKLGLVGHRVPLNVNFMFCPECAEEQIEEFGEAFWRRDHNITGNLICLKHERPLVKGPLIKQGNRQRMIPFIYGYLNEYEPIEYSEEVTGKATLIGEYIEALLNMKCIRRSPDWVTKKIRLILIEKGYLSFVGFLHLKKLVVDFMSFYGDEYLNEINCNITSESSNWVADLVRINGKSTHPLKIVLMLAFLKIDPLNIFDDYVTEDGCSSEDDYLLLWEEMLRELMSLGLSRRQLCKTLKCSAKTVTEALDRLNINYNFKSNGGGRHLGRNYTETKLFADKKNKNRKLWEALIIEHPKATNGELQILLPVIHRWLVKYDIEWLRQHLPNITKIGYSYDWESMDLEYLEKTKFIINDMISGRPDRVSFSIIGGKLGVSGWFTNALHKLPKTKAFIEQHILSIEEHQQQRLEWAIKHMLKNGGEITLNKVSEVSGINRRYISVERFEKLINGNRLGYYSMGGLDEKEE